MLLKIIFAGGCFWSMQIPFDLLKGQGVTDVVVGYSGGHKKDPSYSEVVAGNTGHREVVEVTYDPQKIPLSRILETYWTNIDPLNAIGQFCDKGEQYKTAIFYSSEDEKKLIEKSMEEAKRKIKIKGDFLTAILPAKEFYRGEAIHQNFYLEHDKRYKAYKFLCGRDSRLKELW